MHTFYFDQSFPGAGNVVKLGYFPRVGNLAKSAFFLQKCIFKKAPKILLLEAAFPILRSNMASEK